MASPEVREDIVQLHIAAYGSPPDAALVAELEAITDGGGGLFDVAAALTTGDRWEERYPMSQTAGEFADEWLGRLLSDADAALMAAARDAVTGHIAAGGGFASLVLAAQGFLSGPDVPAQFADVANSFLDRSEKAMRSVVQELSGSSAELREALAPAAGDADASKTASDALIAAADAAGDYEGDGAVDDSRTKTLDAFGRPTRVEYDFNSDGKTDLIETYAYNGSITTRLIEFDDGRGLGTLGVVSGDGTFDRRLQETIVDHATFRSIVRFLVDQDNDGIWDKQTEPTEFDVSEFLDGIGMVGVLHSFDVNGWLDSSKRDFDLDGTHEEINASSYSFHEDGGLKTWLIEVDGEWDAGAVPFDGVVDRTLFWAFDVDGFLESSKHDYDNDGTYDRIIAYTYHENGNLKTELSVHDGATYHNDNKISVFVSTTLSEYDTNGALEVWRWDYENDDAYDQVDIYTYHENGNISTRLTEWDDGSGGAVPADGIVDRVQVSTYNIDGRLERLDGDYDNDGTYEWVSVYTYHQNGNRKTQLVEYDGYESGGKDEDGVVDRIELLMFDINGQPEFTKIDNNADGTYDEIIASGHHSNGSLTWPAAHVDKMDTGAVDGSIAHATSFIHGVDGGEARAGDVGGSRPDLDPGERIVIVGGRSGEDFHRDHFLPHAVHESDLSDFGS